MKRFKVFVLALTVMIAGGGLVSSPFSWAKSGSILNSKHNLSISGPGSIRAVKEKEVCVFCHTPHGAAKEGPMWNRSLSPAKSYRVPSSVQSPSLLSRPANPPDGDSRLCLSCHDGTVALGAVLNRGGKKGDIVMTGTTGGKLPVGASNLGTDLTGSHVISVVMDQTLLQKKNSQGVSFRYQYPVDKDVKLRPTHNGRTVGAGKMSSGVGVQCTTCHDPHDDSNTRFLVVPARNNEWSKLCTACHSEEGHVDSSHRECSDCHRGHGEVNTSMLKTKADRLCFDCHNPSAAAKISPTYRFTRRRTVGGEPVMASGSYDIETAFNKTYRHPVADTTRFHQFGEELPEKNSAAQRHAACQDCHDQHRSTSDNPLGDVRGYSAARSKVVNKAKEYEICYKCHSDSANLPSRQKNKRLQFNLHNPSYHPVEGPGRNRRVPSLIKSMDIQTTIKCTDCHGNDDPYGARGPHGSNIEGLLSKNYNTTDMQSESPYQYALCYQCHDRNSILRNDSFKEHRRHLQEGKAACYTCHDAHGSQFYPHLINFDRQVVFPNSEGRLDYLASVQDGRPTCYLKCHNKDHGILQTMKNNVDPLENRSLDPLRRRGR